jgi:hypothetical protein
MAAGGWGRLVFAGEHDAAALSRAVARGTLRRLGRGVYTGAVDDDPAAVVGDHLYEIIAHDFPGAVFVDRSARNPRPTNGRIFVAHDRQRPVELAGLVVHPRPGGHADGDISLPHGLWLASPARGLLDNLAPRRGPNASRRLLEREAIEDWVEELLVARGEPFLNSVRDHARRIAAEIGRARELEILDGIIGAALTTRSSSGLRSPRLAARADGIPYDRAREDAFHALRAALDAMAPDIVPDLPADVGRRRLFPFYEAYFSNFIEGTEFTVDEAAAIVLEGKPIEERPEDSHDILGTYQLVADPAEMAITPSSYEELEELLKRRHAVVLGGRPEALPGDFKKRNNRAGGTEFVDHTLVAGTLRRGLEIATGLTSPFARAVYMMFLVAEVHPFADGNGRIARIMMNAELAAAAEARIIIPTVYRTNYLMALKGATHNRHYAGLVSMLAFARRYTARIDFTDRATAEADLERTNAFRDPTEADAAGIRLVLP